MLDPTRTTLPRHELIAALAGEDAPDPCWPCRGTGQILVGPGRGVLHTCPACRGTGIQEVKR